MSDHRPVDPEKARGYAESFVPPRPPAVALMEERAAKEGFPIIGPACGWFCYQVARMTGARKIFELGSGFGYSTYWFALAAKENGGGEVHHTVWDEGLSRQAREAMESLGLSDQVRFHVSEAVAALEAAQGPFDLLFCDIDKEGYPGALEAAKPKLRPGGAMIFDNVLWDGRIFDPEDRKPSTEGIRELARRIRSDPAWAASVVPLRDGLLLAWRRP